jgi:hypothetical protein
VNLQDIKSPKAQSIETFTNSKLELSYRGNLI